MIQEHPATVRGHYSEARWGQLHSYRAGPDRTAVKPPLVCFHLSPGSGRMYRPFLAEIGRDRLAIAADTPGYGQSDPPPAPPSLEAYAEVLAQLVDDLSPGPVDLFGAHTGSRLAVEIARLRPAQVRRLILFGAAVYSDEERARQKVTYGAQPAEPDGGHFARKWSGWASWRGPGVSDEMIGRYAADSVRDHERAWWAHRAVFEHDMGRRLGELDHEVLVLCTRDDIEGPTRRAREVIRNGRYVERLDWGHWFLETDVPGAAALARDFLDAT